VEEALAIHSPGFFYEQSLMFALPHAMTKIELARVIAARTTARFVEIAPRRGIRVGDAMRKLREEDAKRLSEILEAELERLIRNW
jgi:hypothetical protein